MVMVEFLGVFFLYMCKVLVDLQENIGLLAYHFLHMRKKFLGFFFVLQSG